MNTTAISWTTFSANPLKYRQYDGRVVWACVKISPGCAHCYSEALATRWKRGEAFIKPNMEGLMPFLDEGEVKQMLTARAIQGVPVSGSRCFVGDMTDVFGEWVPDELLDQLFAVFALRPDVTWQVLTKRAERMRDYVAGVNSAERHHDINRACQLIAGSAGAVLPTQQDGMVSGVWPLPNVHLGVSAEDQQRLDERVPFLRKTPAVLRFLSLEPLLGDIDLSKAVDTGRCKSRQGGTTIRCGLPADHEGHDHTILRGSGYAWWAAKDIEWVIVGGESGAGRRNCEVEWIARIVEQCKANGVRCHVKQDMGQRPGQRGRIPLEVWQAKEFPRPVTTEDV